MKKYTTWIVLMIIGIICFVAKWMIWSTVGVDGILHEAFVLIPIGYIFIFLGIVFLAVVFIVWLLNGSDK